ncbi:MAG: hypothetical protein E2580_03770, partial [Pseudomonas sp.]|nr:hypothetical protein [Pseudomonas sp.]
MKPLSQDCAVVETVKIPVGAGLPAKRPGLLANHHPPFTVAAATVFAGKPAPTSDRWWTHVGGRACWPI